MPLGLEDGRVLSGSLRASSSYNYNHGPDRARLNIYAGHGRTGAWVARHRNTRQWLQVDLRGMGIIKGIATQGRREANQWVSRYILSYSKNGLRFRTYTANGRLRVRMSSSKNPLVQKCAHIGLAVKRFCGCHFAHSHSNFDV